MSGESALPGTGPTIIVSNRSGVFPYDGLMLAHAIERQRGFEYRPRFLIADWLMGDEFPMSPRVLLCTIFMIVTAFGIYYLVNWPKIVDFLAQWCDQYPICSIEDGCAEDDWDSWKKLTQKIGGRTRLVGDDL